MNQITPTHIRLGRTADDVFFAIVVLKESDCESRILPFLHAHCLELSVKAACHVSKIQDGSTKSHDIKSLLEKLSSLHLDLKNLLLDKQYFENYPKLFPPEGSVDFSTLEIPLPAIVPFQELQKYEMAHLICNVVHLKYEMDRSEKFVSEIRYPYEEINANFLNLFAFCRNLYKDQAMDEKLQEKLGRKSENKIYRHQLIGQVVGSES
jgi:hypothetical protein